MPRTAIACIPPADGVVYIQVANNIGAPYTMHVLIIETTLFSPWWFTGGTNQAFVEVRNNMNDTTDAKLTAYGATGAVCGTTTLSIPGNGNTAVVDQFPWVVCLYRVRFGADRVPRHACGAGRQYHDDRRRKRHVIRLAIHATDGLVDVQPLTR